MMQQPLRDEDSADHPRTVTVAAISVPSRSDGGLREVCLVVRTPRGIVTATKPGYPLPIFRLPTGGLQIAEDAETGARRELREEFGVDADELVVAGRISYLGPGGLLVFETIVVEATVLDPGLIHLGEELSDIAFVEARGLSELADKLESLPSVRHRDTTLQDWGRFRAVAHRFVATLVSRSSQEAAT